MQNKKKAWILLAWMRKFLARSQAWGCTESETQSQGESQLSAQAVCLTGSCYSQRPTSFCTVVDIFVQYLTPAFLWEAAAAVAEVAQAAAVAAVARKHWLFASVAATTAVCTYSAAAEMNPVCSIILESASDSDCQTHWHCLAVACDLAWSRKQAAMCQCHWSCTRVLEKLGLAGNCRSLDIANWCPEPVPCHSKSSLPFKLQPDLPMPLGSC